MVAENQKDPQRAEQLEGERPGRGRRVLVEGQQHATQLERIQHQTNQLERAQSTTDHLERIPHQTNRLERGSEVADQGEEE